MFSQHCCNPEIFLLHTKNKFSAGMWSSICFFPCASSTCNFICHFIACLLSIIRSFCKSSQSVLLPASMNSYPAPPSFFFFFSVVVRREGKKWKGNCGLCSTDTSYLERNPVILTRGNVINGTETSKNGLATMFLMHNICVSLTFSKMFSLMPSLKLKI